MCLSHGIYHPLCVFSYGVCLLLFGLRFLRMSMSDKTLNIQNRTLSNCLLESELVMGGQISCPHCACHYRITIRPEKSADQSHPPGALWTSMTVVSLANH